MNRSHSKPGQPGRSKRAYRSPRLVEFGDITKLTQNGQGSGPDSGTMSGMFMMCL